MKTVEKILPTWCAQYLMYGFDDNTTPEEDSQMDHITEGLRLLSADTENSYFQYGSDYNRNMGDTVCLFTFALIE